MLVECIAFVVSFSIQKTARVHWHMMGSKIGGTSTRGYKNMKVVSSILPT